ncbi:SET domain-containing protein SmydA-8-like [Adelges cooleyi]|uniref:SET domain-containing protein SmydA-8-like n=1 Tax=Adelges cooleyi TaxID=133065 RepID=UPI00217F507D|nr:SET domain-containing protein SmydA-8-like [Adelges cooleyi]
MATVPEPSPCSVCRRPAGHRCGKCGRASYCGRPHQLADWPTHKAECRRPPYELRECPTLGRHWVARDRVPAGRVLLEEKPLACGPKPASPPVCLACHARLRSAAHKCRGCGWPACDAGNSCGPHHSAAECRLIAGHSPFGDNESFESCASHSAYCFVLPLRCLLLEGDNRRAFRGLQSHLNERLDTALYRIYRVNLVQFVLDRLGMRASGLDDVDVLEAAAVLDTNSFEVRCGGGAKIRAVYAQASMMAHHCRPNTKHVFVDGGRWAIRVLATVAIGEGQPVTATYTQSLWRTRERRKHLKAAKCFDCACDRCTDPTEFGTHLGSAVCSDCGGYVAPDRVECSGGCGTEHDRVAYELKVAEAERRVRSFDRTDLQAFEDFLERQVYGPTRLFHCNHFVAVSVKYALTQLYNDRILDLSSKQLDNNVKICKELLTLADVLDPGLTRFRGLLLYYIQQSLGRRLTMKPKRDDCRALIKKCRQEAKSILITEPDLAHLVDLLPITIKTV